MSDTAVWIALLVVHGLGWLVLVGAAAHHPRFRHRRSQPHQTQ